MPVLRSISLALLVAGLGAATAQADPVSWDLHGPVTEVNDSPFAGGAETEGVEVGDPFSGTLTYNDATAQGSGTFVSFELTALKLTVPDTTQPGGSFDLVPDDLNSATRIVFSAPSSVYGPNEFQGLVLPENVTGWDDLSAFGLTGLAFESSGFSGPEIKFNLGVPVVEGVLFIVNPVPTPPLALGLLAAALLACIRRRLA